MVEGAPFHPSPTTLPNSLPISTVDVLTFQNPQTFGCFCCLFSVLEAAYTEDAPARVMLAPAQVTSGSSEQNTMTVRQKKAAAAGAAMTQPDGSHSVRRRQSFERKVSTRTKRQAKALGDTSAVSGCE